MTSTWLDKPVKCVLLDITGVLYNSGHGDGEVIQGSINAVKRLKNAGLPVRFCTNETTSPKSALLAKLIRLGFSMQESDIFSPVPAILQVLHERKLRPYLLVHPDVVSEFGNIDTSDPNCVVLGDAMDEFSYFNMNKAFQILVSLKEPILFSMGKGKYYKDKGNLTMDVGAFMKALEYASDAEAEIVGKPSPSFFNAAIKNMNLSPQEVVMVGDDLVNDVGGAMDCNMRGILVRTGKYRPSDESHPTVKPSGIVDNLAGAVDLILGTPL